MKRYYVWGCSGSLGGGGGREEKWETRERRGLENGGEKIA